jgi:hypothetical protein
LATALEDGPDVALPQICNAFEVPLECPEVTATIYQWIINGVSIRVIWSTVPNCRAWTRWRETDEAGTSPGPWSFWREVETVGVYQLWQDTIVATGLTPYDWYDVQMRHEPEGYDGWQEIWPLCGGWWHLQTPSKILPPPEPPIEVPDVPA